MKIECAVSLGELVDKLSILMIKEKKINDHAKLTHIQHEQNILENTLNSLNLEGIAVYLEKMIEVNLKLWQIEDDIRDCERIKDFGQKFIDLARAVYITNDLRFELKNKINLEYQSNIVEVKSYQKY